MMSIEKHIFSENIKEIESLIKKKFKNDLNEKFGHSNFPFDVKNININKFKRVFVSAVLDERKIEEKREINYSGLREARKKHKGDVNIFSYTRDNCVIENVGKSVEYRVDESNQTETCGTCRGLQQITCDTCRGSGKNRCGTCNGQRQVKCTSCNGRGEINCGIIFGCGGKGYKTSYENGRNIRRTCSSCNGRGKDPCSSCVNGYNTCSTCNGNGEVSCYTCHSSGKVDCYSCDAQGTFTKFLSVNSILIKKENNLVVEGNNPGDFISKKLISEEYSFEDDFIKYQITSLSDYKNHLKELFSGLLPNKMQEGRMIYASLDECASLTFEILVGESTYLGFLKNGALWFDDSVMNLLFYDVIDGMNVDSSFSKIMENKAAFEGNLSNTDVIWKSIKQYNNFEKLISSKKSVSSKISDARKFNLLNTDTYLKSLYPKFIKRRFFQKLILTIISIFLLIGIYGGDGAMLFIGYTDFLLIPLLSFLVAIFMSRILITTWSPSAVSIVGFILLGFGLGYTGVKLHDRSSEFQNYLYNKEQEKIEYDLKLSKMKNFQNFKKDHLMISYSEFQDLNRINEYNSYDLYSSNDDSIIVVRPSGNLDYTFFLDPGVEYTWKTNAHCSSCGRYCYGHEKVTDDRMGLNIGYNSFIEKKGYYSNYKVTIGGPGGFSDYEVSPKDIKFEVYGYGVSVMKNLLDAYEGNALHEVYLGPESFVKFFPDSEIISQNMNKYYYFNSRGELKTGFTN